MDQVLVQGTRSRTVDRGILEGAVFMAKVRHTQAWILLAFVE